MFARSAIVATALLAIVVGEAANAQGVQEIGASVQPLQPSTTVNAQPLPAPAANAPGVSMTPPAAFPARAVPALATPSSAPTLQQIRR